MLKDTADGDGVAEMAAQSAATKAIGDLTAHELRERFAEYLNEIHMRLQDVRGFLSIAADLPARARLNDLIYRVAAALREVKP